MLCRVTPDGCCDWHAVRSGVGASPADVVPPEGATVADDVANGRDVGDDDADNVGGVAEEAASLLRAAVREGVPVWQPSGMAASRHIASVTLVRFRMSFVAICPPSRTPCRNHRIASRTEKGVRTRHRGGTGILGTSWSIRDRALSSAGIRELSKSGWSTRPHEISPVREKKGAGPGVSPRLA